MAGQIAMAVSSPTAPSASTLTLLQRLSAGGLPGSAMLWL